MGGVQDNYELPYYRTDLMVRRVSSTLIRVTTSSGFDVLFDGDSLLEIAVSHAHSANVSHSTFGVCVIR